MEGVEEDLVVPGGAVVAADTVAVEGAMGVHLWCLLEAGDDMAHTEFNCCVCTLMLFPFIWQCALARSNFFWGKVKE